MATPSDPPHADQNSDLHRRREWFRSGQGTADVLVIGAGVVGAAIHHHLAKAGYHSVIVDRSDIASGASQGSANLIWGGLLYLSQGRLLEVAKWTHSRDRLARDPCSGVRDLTCGYRIDPSRRHPGLVRAALMGYWLLSGCRGPAPREREGHLWFGEAALIEHDARFTWRWLATAPGDSLAMNHCSVEKVQAHGDGWSVDLVDRLNGGRKTLRCAMVINATGAWAPRVDSLAGIDHGWNIVPSRGVSLVVAGGRNSAVFVEHPDHRDVLSLVPFPGGDACIWGSTETLVTDPDRALVPDAQEVSELVDLHRRLIGPLVEREVLAVRCGLRALAVRRGKKPQRSQDLTRGFRILGDHRPWITVLGGKLTGCSAVAGDVVRRVQRRLGQRKPLPARSPASYPTIRFPGLMLDLPDPVWCRDHEQCWSLDDWLRRRTPVAQLIPRRGLGWNDENTTALLGIAAQLLGDQTLAVTAVAALATAVDAEHHRLFPSADKP